MKTRKSRPMGVYWINLDRSTERRENMITLLKDPVFDGMSKHRVEAVDGKKMTEEKVRSYFGNISSKFSIKEYCCLWSHLKALVQFSKSHYTLAIILEDDISLEYKPYWQESIKDCIRNAPADWEVLQLSYTFQNEFPTSLYTHTIKHNGAFSYVVNKKGIVRFLKQFHLDDNPHVADYLLFNQMNAYTYQYPFFTYTAKDSEIHTDHIKTKHIPSKLKIEEYLRTRKFPLKEDILYVTSMKRIDLNALKVPYILILYVDTNIKKQLPFLTNIIVRDIDEVKSNQNQKYQFLSHTKYLYPYYQFYSWVDL